MKTISLLIPVYNEEETLDALYSQLNKLICSELWGGVFLGDTFCK